MNQTSEKRMIKPLLHLRRRDYKIHAMHTEAK